ncbi:hypothetical protein MPHL43072_10815 [Mycolicibacterium phlei DSM 43072]|uniref:Uncharacterized protein n=1 Tax=Mycolicibacterium phlei DSM 43239 = CCUG 21000 TaxID=1226750 RepID=A0A5N5VDN6_MYCPH|nr:hypothetical protein MPHL21000_00525 [Mycolicibacterium phlei DSM 43239 = CCUG 21000]KXW60172.1 hypothetical protein MPHL43072_10815 [Mycolicibacterium phlei DSM 43072]KXW69074.1 hypothetical protein MPHL43239_00565 [Mycolicibacterium phlei DSM 43239 = CCUG 21000]KXW72923.1 hypothetical protein MPHL43070_13920 [Mycolicibacterium phlei DSM 43070]KXW78240.1 hypothetical protein JL15_07550 [Mycolicibacterium phlei DSM 43071]
MSAQRVGHRVGAAGPQPVLEQALGEQIRRDHHPAGAAPAQSGDRVGHPRLTGGGVGQLDAVTERRRQQRRRVPQIRQRAGVRRARRRQHNGITGAPTTFEQPVHENPGQLRAGSQRRGHRHVAVSADRDVRGDVRLDVIAARQERRHQDRAVGCARQHLARGGAEHVDERDVHRLVQRGRNLFGQ